MHAQVKPCPTCFIHTQHAISIRHLWQASLACMCFSPPWQAFINCGRTGKDSQRGKDLSQEELNYFAKVWARWSRIYIYIYMVADVLLIEGVVLHNICFNSQDRESQSVKVLCCCNKSISLTRVSGWWILVIIKAETLKVFLYNCAALHHQAVCGVVVKGWC